MSDVAAADEGTNTGATDQGDGTTVDAGQTQATNGKDDSQSTGIWPDNWREEWASANGAEGKVAEQRLKRLGRWDQPGRVFDSYLEMEQTLKKADIRTPFPEEGDEKAQAKWRKDNNIPAEAAGYLEELPDGLVIGEEDMAGMTTLAETMHAAHAPAGMAHAAISAYYKHVENVLAQQAEADAEAARKATDDLAQTYGPDSRRNTNDLEAWLGSAGEELKNKIYSARTQDGTPLLSEPGFLKWMIGQMRTINPLQTVPGLGGGDPAAALADEIAAIEKTIRTDNAAYNADKAMQARYLELLDARMKHKAA